MRKILMPIGDAVEALDTFYPFFRLPEEGYDIVVAGPEARLYHTVLHEVPPNANVPWDITEERPGYHMQADIAFRDVKPDEYAALFVSGGRAPEYLRYDDDLLRITREIVAAGKPVCCLCHGIEILSAAGVIEGKRVCTVSKCALDAEQGGATYVGDTVTVDGQFVTAGGWQNNTELLREFVRLLRELPD